jgi:adenylate kinase family enzyme
MIREVDKDLKDEKRKKELINFLENNYRGFQPLEEMILSMEKRNARILLPTELILALVKREIAKKEKKALFIDGFPRDLDQINFSLFFRDLVGYRDDPDVFILIDVPRAVIDERIKWRRICPLCQTSRNLKLLPTSKIGYKEEKKEFYLICDNPNCLALPPGGPETEMVSKEGDEQGIEPIKERLEKDEKLIEKAISLQGIPKVFLRNSLPRDAAKEYVDDYEITPEYVYQKINGEVKIEEKPWLVLDDEGAESFSLLPPPVVVSLIKQIVEVLKI